jgi:hypothetical protein
MQITELRVGDPVRRRARFAIVISLVIVMAYGGVTILTKEVHGFDVHQPWQDDPYDVPVSFDFVFLPVLVVLGALRVQLCRRTEPLPVRRLDDLLRLCAVATALCGLTELAEWVAVALDGHRSEWTVVTTWQVVTLGLLSGATAGCGLLIHRVRLELASRASVGKEPDWLSDALVLCIRQARRLGPLQGPAEAGARCLDRQLLSRIRTHPVVAAWLLAMVLALPFVAAKAFLEQYPAPLLAFVFALSTACLFAFVVVAGALLRVVAPRSSERSLWLCASVAACVAGPAVFAFHDSLLASAHLHQTAVTLSILLTGGGLLAGGVSLVLQTSFRRIRH